MDEVYEDHTLLLNSVSVLDTCIPRMTLVGHGEVVQFKKIFVRFLTIVT